MIRFTVNSTEFSNRLQSLSKVVITKGLPICGSILFSLESGNMVLSATDMETFVQYNLNISENKEEGKFAIQARLLTDMLKCMPEQPLFFTVDQNSNQLKVNYQNGNNSFMSEQSVDSFPNCMKLEETTASIIFHSSILLENVSQSLLPFTADDEP